jgi:hypothetical protein
MAEDKEPLEKLVNQEEVGDKINDVGINVGYLALYLDNEAGFGVEENDYFLLDRVVNQVKTRVGWKGQYTDHDIKNLFNTIHTVLRGLNFRKHGKSTTFFESLRQKDLSTFSSLIYLTIASEVTYSDNLPLPIHAIALPYDFFVTWPLSRTVHVNWNPSDGLEVTDIKCMEKYHFENVQHVRHVYITPLNRNGVASQIYVWRAMQRLIRGELESALVDSNNAVELNPNNINAYIVRGDVRRVGNKLDEAIADYDCALQMHSDHVKALQRRGEARMRMKFADLEGAITDFTRKLGIMPRSESALYYRSLAFLGSGNAHAARKDSMLYKKLIAAR